MKVSDVNYFQAMKVNPPAKKKKPPLLAPIKEP